MAENTVSERECDNKHDTLSKWVESLSDRVNRLEGKLWLIITLLFGNLAALATLIGSTTKH